MLALWWCHSATGTEGTQLSGGKCTHALQKNVTKCRFFSLVRDAVASLHRDEKKKKASDAAWFYAWGQDFLCWFWLSRDSNRDKKREDAKSPLHCNNCLSLPIQPQSFPVNINMRAPSSLTYMKTYFLVTILYVLFHPLSSACVQYHFSSGSFGCTCPANSCKLIIGIFIAFTNHRLWLSSSHPATLSQHTRTYTLSVRPARDSINFLRWANEQTGAS